MAVSLKIKHTVYHMFQNLRASEIAFLVYMADDKNCNTIALGQLHQGHSTLFYLRNAARRCSLVSVIHRLNRVYDENIRGSLFYCGNNLL